MWLSWGCENYLHTEFIALFFIRNYSVEMSNADIERTTPLGLARYAFEYMDAAIIVNDARGTRTLLSQAAYTPAYYLAFHSIELSLKAYLLSKGEELKQLPMRYGHDLQHLYDSAMVLGLKNDFEQDERDLVALHLLIDLNANQQLRYLRTGFKQFPAFSIVEPFGVRLHQAISKSINSRTFTQCYTDY
jgi:hypothetical protein